MSKMSPRMIHHVLDLARANVIKAHHDLHRLTKELLEAGAIPEHRGFAEDDAFISGVYDEIYEMGLAAGVDFEKTPFTVVAFPGTEEEIHENNKFFVKDSIEEVEVLMAALAVKHGGLDEFFACSEMEDTMNCLDIAKQGVNMLIDAE